MAIHMPRILYAKQIIKKNTVTANLTCPTTADVPKGYCEVYVGEQEMKRFVIPISFLNQPLFQDLLNQSEEEFSFDHPMGGLTIPCSEETFVDFVSRFYRL